ncbi:hypothetical protein B0181_06425 [Moraxella caviae]|uniref:Copper export protein n=1 Tax=Moraxella caviae TaxID=34060 RepID=A0A1T0A2S6_9GAMM|nr:CopD family protein [Moraxella caviae]OOR89601.1 hypothetical protein B0181_06425 [Moraxella caviae]STZ10285.1 Putative copper export protein [Moraxella caviae]
MQKIALFFHLLGACIWVGGHLYLLVRLMPNFIKNQDVKGFLAFEKSYEPLGMAALLLQVITGAYLLSRFVPASLWFSPLGSLGALIHAKFLWLILTLLTALHARFRVVARLERGTHDDKTLKNMGVHVLLICVWSVAFVATGMMFRWGGAW